MAYTAPPTKSTGNTLAAADWNTYVKDNMIAVATPPVGWVNKNANQSLSASTNTLLTWPATHTLTGFTLVSNALKPTVAGIYKATTRIEWESNSTSIRLVYFYLNGVVYAQFFSAPANGTATTQHFSALINCAAVDAVTVQAQQNTAGALNVTGNSEFWMELVSY